MKKTILIILILFYNCSVTKKHIYTEKELNKKIDSISRTKIKIVKDSIEVIKTETIIKPVTTYVEIPIECDSLGNAKNIKYKYKSGNSFINAKIENNRLLLESKTDSIINSLEKTFILKFKKDSSFITSNAIASYIKNTSELEVKQENWLLRNFKCLLLIIFLLAVISLLIRYQLKN